MITERLNVIYNLWSSCYYECSQAIQS